MSDHPNPFGNFRSEFYDSELKDRYELYMVLFAGGKRIAQRLVYTTARTPQGLAQCDNHHYLLQAICRFLNTGSDPVNAFQLAEEAFKFSEDRYLELSEPWELLTVRFETPDATTIFINRSTGRVIVRKEDLYTEEMDLKELLEQIEDGPCLNDSRTQNTETGSGENPGIEGDNTQQS
jgi:hypothetical protein